MPTGKGFQDAEPQTQASAVPLAPADRLGLHLSQVKGSSTGQCAENKDSVLSSKRDIDIQPTTTRAQTPHSRQEEPEVGRSPVNATFREWHSFAIILTATVVTLHKTIPDQARQNPGIGGVDDLQVSPLNEESLIVNSCWERGNNSLLLRIWTLVGFAYFSGWPYTQAFIGSTH